jgi:hypothetical protein
MKIDFIVFEKGSFESSATFFGFHKKVKKTYKKVYFTHYIYQRNNGGFFFFHFFTLLSIHLDGRRGRMNNNLRILRYYTLV